MILSVETIADMQEMFAVRYFYSLVQNLNLMQC